MEDAIVLVPFIPYAAVEKFFGPALPEAEANANDREEIESALANLRDNPSWLQHRDAAAETAALVDMIAALCCIDIDIDVDIDINIDITIG